jgi:hypothetical protein
MAADPAALQLRLLQTVVEVAAEKNSTLVMPFPVELLRFFDNAAPASLAAPRPAAREAADDGEIAGAETPASLPAALTDAVRALASPESPAAAAPATTPASAAEAAPLNSKRNGGSPDR